MHFLFMGGLTGLVISILFCRKRDIRMLPNNYEIPTGLLYIYFGTGMGMLLTTYCQRHQ